MESIKQLTKYARQYDAFLEKAKYVPIWEFIEFVSNVELPLNKKDFCLAINQIIRVEDYFKTLDNVLKKVSNETDFLSFYPCWETIMVDWLEKTVHDEHDWISWWLWDTNRGKEHAEITHADGKKFPLNSVSKLFDYLKKECPECKLR